MARPGHPVTKLLITDAERAELKARPSVHKTEGRRRDDRGCHDLIGAPSSTGNASKTRDPDTHQTCKGQQRHFGMKMHIGVDSRTGLLHGEARRGHGDSTHASQKALIRAHAAQAKDFTSQRVRKRGADDEAERSRNRNKSRIRARVEHVFAVAKRLWRVTRVRYRGLDENAHLYLSRTRVPA